MKSGPKKIAKLTVKEIILLGLIGEEPAHAYLLESKIRDRKMTHWTEISFSSIYRVLAGLENKKLISARLLHEGQGATRKVHELTQTGKELFEKGLLERLREVEKLSLPFNVGLAFIDMVPREEAINCLSERLSTMKEIEQFITQSTDNGACTEGIKPNQKLRKQLLLDHVLAHFQVEYKFILKTLDFLSSEQANPLYEKSSQNGRNKD